MSSAAGRIIGGTNGAHVWTIIGLVIDIFGALLLSIEAIKVRTLDSAAQRLFRFAGKIPGGVRRVGGSFRERAVWGFLVTAFWCGLAITSVVLFIVLAGEVSLDRSWHAALVAMALVVVGLFALLCFGLTAALGVLGLRLLTEAAVRGVVVVETRTADGTIGMVGAEMLVMGFSMQIIGAA